jgi:23S rRNA U2552 (ribose-2'-O)-methylase RlmE/FtsJ
MFDCLIKPNDVVVDLGSNVGFFSVKSSEFASKVISIDGSPEAYSCLVENCKDLQNVLTLNANILSPESEQSWLWSVKGNPLRMTLDDVFDLYQLDRIDFLKCDIEGGEYDLFNSLSEDTLSKIDRIAIETHDDNKNEHFSLPGKIKHSFYWTYNGGHQTMLYFTTPKNI